MLGSLVGGVDVFGGCLESWLAAARGAQPQGSNGAAPLPPAGRNSGVGCVVGDYENSRASRIEAQHVCTAGSW